MPQCQAVFCTAYRFTHPETKNAIVFLGDIHIDVDPQLHLTRIQQHDLVEAAKEIDALVLAETTMLNHDYYYSGLGHAINSVALAYFIKNKAYLASAWALGWLAYGVCGDYPNRLTTKSPYSFDEYMQRCACYARNEPMKIYKSISPLTNLVQSCQKQGVKAISCEFRYHSDSTSLEEERKNLSWFFKLDHLLYQGYVALYGKFFGTPFFYPRTLADYSAVHDRIIKQCLSDTGSAVVNLFCKRSVRAYYKSPITRVVRQLALENPSKSLRTLVPDLAAKIGHNNRTALSQFHVHNAQLLDAFMMQAIYKQRATKNIIVCAGAAHIEQLVKCIKMLGYQEEQRLGVNDPSTLLYIYDGQTIRAQDVDLFAIDIKKIFVHQVPVSS